MRDNSVDTLRLERRITIVLVLNFLIVIGAGHGIACLAMIEAFWFPYVNTEYFTFKIFTSYDNSLGAACLFSLVGQVLLILALIVKRMRLIIRVIMAGCFFLFIGFMYLTHEMLRGDAVAFVSFITGSPFLITSSILLFKLKKMPD
ncbi:MAG TPA: hypothetical protein VL443_01045 [Cyclobacteriaceae bacterium]|nr:hypothetical protein [Cyclobacteriaceae bacterium]